MLRKIVSLLSVLLISQLGFTQSGLPNTNKLALKLSPLSFYVPNVGGSARLALEYRIAENWTFENEIGYFFIHSKGYMTRFETKYYLPGWSDGTYYGFDLFYKHHDYPTSDTIGGSFKDFIVTKDVGTASLKYGRITTFKSGFIVDLYCGLGLRLQRNRNTLSDYENSIMTPNLDYNINLILNQARTRFYPNFIAGIKLGWRIK